MKKNKNIYDNANKYAPTRLRDHNLWIEKS